jgi:hypothetical protein
MSRPGAERRGGPRRSQDGVVAVLVALLVPVLVAVAAIVIDLGQAYADGRQLQNAADAAALAATRALDRVHVAGDAPSTVQASARAVATANGSELAQVGCTVIDWRGTPIGPCSDQNAVTHRDADGVLVKAGASRRTIFGGAVGMLGAGPGWPTLNQTRNSAATAQPLIGQDAPLLACAFNQTDGQTPSPDILVGTSTAYAINPLAVGKRYMLHDPNVSDCGLPGSSFKGDAGPGPFQLPGWIDIATGVKAGPIRSRIAGEIVCNNGLVVGCALVLPVCTRNNGESGINGQLFCDLFAAFRLVHADANTHVFELLGPVTVIEGVGGPGKPDPRAPRLIKLIA